MWKFIVDVVHDFASSLQPDVGWGFLHVSNMFLFWVDVIEYPCHNINADLLEISLVRHLTGPWEIGMLQTYSYDIYE